MVVWSPGPQPGGLGPASRCIEEPASSILSTWTFNQWEHRAYWTNQSTEKIYLIGTWRKFHQWERREFMFKESTENIEQRKHLTYENTENISPMRAYRICEENILRMKAQRTFDRWEHQSNWPMRALKTFYQWEHIHFRTESRDKRKLDQWQ